MKLVKKMSKLKKFMNENSGQGAAEYILLFGGVIVIALLALTIYRSYMNTSDVSLKAKDDIIKAKDEVIKAKDKEIEDLKEIISQLNKRTTHSSPFFWSETTTFDDMDSNISENMKERINSLYNKMKEKFNGRKDNRDTDKQAG